MPGNSSVLALFSSQPPVEPTAPKADRGSDSDFNDFLSNATDQVDKTQKLSSGDSANNNSEAEVGRTSKPKIKNNTDKPETDNGKYQETAAAIVNEPITQTEPVTKDSILEENAAFASKLNELGIDQEQFQALLEHLGLKGDVNIDSLLQSLTQGLSQNGIAVGKDIDTLSQSELLARLQQHEGEAINLLKKAGLTDDLAKNLLDHLKSTHVTNIAQKEADKTLDLNLKKDIQTQQEAISTEKVTLKTTEQSETSKNRGQQEKGNETNVPVQVKENSIKAEKLDRAASIDKLPETPKVSEAPRITPPEPLRSKGAQSSNNLSQLLNDNNAQATLLQTNAGKDAGSVKGLDSAKVAPDLQVQAPTAAADNLIKAVESSKSVLPEKLIARGATETKIISQIVNKLSTRGGGAQNEVQIRLDPPSLGTVRLNIITVGDSVRTMIIAENHAVKQTIENNFNQLRDAMSEQGLKVDSFSVTVGGESGGSNQNRKQFGEEKSSNPLSNEQVASSGSEGEFEEPNNSFFFDGNQSISVLA
jgi:flagellar hook-length control protein FliK